MTTITPHAISARQNMLLAALPAVQWEWATANFKPIFMPAGDVLYEPAMLVDHVYFPTTSIICIARVMADGWADALTLIGREGFAGVESFLGGASAPCRAAVLGEGWGYRVRRELLNQECGRDDSIRSVLLRYSQSYITQVAQTVTCNRYHSISQQLCRWLLMFLDRQASSELSLTHEHIAELMGVRRESVSEAAHRLQIAGCIRYWRGHISVVERTGLEARSCECYWMARRETDRLLKLSQSAKLAAAHAAVNRVHGGRSEPIIVHALRNLPKGEMRCCTPLRSF
jgi:CRP-like cAMP-binding protein